MAASTPTASSFHAEIVTADGAPVWSIQDGVSVVHDEAAVEALVVKMATLPQPSSTVDADLGRGLINFANAVCRERREAAAKSKTSQEKAA